MSVWAKVAPQSCLGGSRIKDARQQERDNDPTGQLSVSALKAERIEINKG